MARARTIIADYKESFPAAMKCLEQDLEETLTALKFPLVHCVRIRTTNLLERLIGEGRRRTKIIPRFTSGASGLSLVFARAGRCSGRMARGPDEALLGATSATNRSGSGQHLGRPGSSASGSLRINENLNLPYGDYANSFLQEKPDLTFCRLVGRLD